MISSTKERSNRRRSPTPCSTPCAPSSFLILPHPEVREYFARKAADYDRWLRGMQRLRDRVLAG